MSGGETLPLFGLLKIGRVRFKNSDVRFVAVVNFELIGAVDVGEFFDIAGDERDEGEAEEDKEEYSLLLNRRQIRCDQAKNNCRAQRNLRKNVKNKFFHRLVFVEEPGFIFEIKKIFLNFRVDIGEVDEPQRRGYQG